MTSILAVLYTIYIQYILHKQVCMIVRRDVGKPVTWAVALVGISQSNIISAYGGCGNNACDNGHIVADPTSVLLLAWPSDCLRC